MIEEKEKRKVKLGYVDLSVAENWKIIQDHTRGKKMTHTPEVTIYGDNKESPHWYPTEHPDHEGLHTWVSSYADSFGYGYWDPDHYTGASVVPHYPHNAHQGNQQGGHIGQQQDNRYGIAPRQNFDSRRHDGALAEAGIEAGLNGKGYGRAGKWQKGDTTTQLKTSNEGMVMSRRTVTEGGSLSGAAHAAIAEDYD